jgi:hypothetical protein
MGDMDLIVLSKVWEAGQAIAEKRKELSTSCYQAMFGVGSDDVKDSCFCSLRMSWGGAANDKVIIIRRFRRRFE